MPENLYQLEDGSIIEDTGPEVRVLGDHFAMIPRWVFQSVSARGLQCYTAIMLYANWQGDKKSAWPSKKKLASDMRTSVSTVELAIKDLKDAGVLIVEPRATPDGGTASNNYWLITQESQRWATVESAYALWEKQNSYEGGGCVPGGGGGYQSGGEGVTSRVLTRSIEQEPLNESITAAPKPKGIKQERTVVTEEWVESIRSEWEPKLLGHWRSFDQIIEWATNREYYDSTKDKQKYVLGRLLAASKDKKDRSYGNGRTQAQPSSAALHNPVPKSSFEDQKARDKAAWKAAREKGFA